MKKAFIFLGIALLIGGLGWLLFGSSQEAAPTDEPVSVRILTVSPGKILERDNLGNIQILPDANFAAILKPEDLVTALQAEDVETGAALALSRGAVEHKGEEVILNLIGISNPEFLYTYDFSLAEGRFFTADESENVVVIAQNTKEEIEKKGVAALGQILNIRGVEFTIIGITNRIDTGNPTADADWNKLLVIPYQQSDPILEDAPFVEEMRLVAKSSKVVDKAADQVTKLLIESRGEEDFTVLTPADVKAIEELLQ